MRPILKASEIVGGPSRTQEAVIRAASPGAEAKTCRVCAGPIVRPLSPAARRGYCCEGCILAERKQRELAVAADEAQFVLAEALAAALDAREHETGLHSKRVACHTLVLARRFTEDPQLLHQVYWGALLHDIGKIGIPDSILLKRGALAASEWERMRLHPEIGHRILAHAPGMSDAAQIVLCHEERFDGSGYPRGLAGAQIPLWARLFAVIDTLDAITSDRPYRRGAGFDAARAEMLSVSGTQLDPLALEAFVAEETALREMVDLKCGVVGDWPTVVAPAASATHLGADGDNR